MKSIKTVILILLVCKISAQHMSQKEMREDLEYLKTSIIKFNPALSHYHPEFDQLANEIVKSPTEDSVNIFDFFRKVSTICALANEGHFSIGDWDDVVHKGILDDQISYLPISITILEGRLTVTKDYSDERLLKVGDIITQINGHSSDDILNTLMQVTPTDGQIATYGLRKIEDGFHWLYYLYVDQKDVFNITVSSQGLSARTVKVKGLSRSKQVENFQTYFPRKNLKEKEEGFYQLEYHKEFAILKLPSFDFRRVNKYEVKSKRLYKEIFSELTERQIPNLIIDLRDNTGGRNEFADDMVPFIMKQNNADKFLKKTISHEGKVRTYKIPRKSKYVFEGQIYVLINGKTFSAGNTLARYLKEYGNAIAIGSETGTRYEGFAAGSSQDVYLPNSKIRIGIPRYHINFPISTKQQSQNRGLLPDFEISRTPFQEKNEDSHLEKAIKLINK